MQESGPCVMRSRWPALRLDVRAEGPDLQLAALRACRAEYVHVWLCVGVRNVWAFASAEPVLCCALLR